MKEQIVVALEEVFDGQIPAYIVSAGKTYITLAISDWTGNKKLKVTIVDLVNYYNVDARNIDSGIRSLAGHYGDWRNINEIAHLCLAWFRLINRVELAKEAKKHGMTLR